MPRVWVNSLFSSTKHDYFNYTCHNGNSVNFQWNMFHESAKNQKVKDKITLYAFTPLYIGEVLHTPMQNCVPIYIEERQYKNSIPLHNVAFLKCDILTKQIPEHFHTLKVKWISNFRCLNGRTFAHCYHYWFHLCTYSLRGFHYWAMSHSNFVSVMHYTQKVLTVTTRK